MLNIIIVVQNLRMGGFQRVALDEAYSFSKGDQKVTLVLLEEISPESLNNFYSNEFDLIAKFNLDIRIATGSRWQQFLFFKHLIDSYSKPKNFISHNLRATVLIRLASFFSKSRTNLITVIHQLPCMSAPLQRFKRFFYSSFSDVIFLFSEAARRDWNARINSNPFSRVLFRKKHVALLRNGIFLDRIKDFDGGERFDRDAELRLVFLGRPTSWKGVGSILDLAQFRALSNAKVLFFFPYEHGGLFNNLPVGVSERISVVVGRSFRDYVPSFGDVHLYPASYGDSAQFIESISINCLEMASVGIPSFVSKSGLLTWPEFLHNPLFVEVDWSDNVGTVQKIYDSFRTQVDDSEINRIRRIINIENHTSQLLDFMI
jgi:hypothetical protein